MLSLGVAKVGKSSSHLKLIILIYDGIKSNLLYFWMLTITQLLYLIVEPGGVVIAPVEENTTNNQQQNL